MQRKFALEHFKTAVAKITGDEGRLRDSFYYFGRVKPAANLHPHQYVHVPRRIYDDCWRTHGASMRMVNALEAVQKDAEHQLLFDAGHDAGYTMPDFQHFREELEAFKDALSELDPLKSRASHNGYVCITAEQALHLEGVVHYSAFMLSRVLDAAFNTEYLRPFGDYKQAGYAYQGPSALQESMNLMARLIQLSNGVERLAKEGAHNRDWRKPIAFKDVPAPSPEAQPVYGVSL